MDRITYWHEDMNEYCLINLSCFKEWSFDDYINYIGQLEDRIEELENAAN